MAAGYANTGYVNKYPDQAEVSTGFGDNAAKAGSGAPPTVNPSVFGSIENAAGRVSVAIRRVAHLVERLCGVTPEPANTAEQIKVEPNGLLTSGEYHCEQINDDLNAMFALLERLEKRLP